jgi:hypothetical protein
MDVELWQTGTVLPGKPALIVDNSRFTAHWQLILW